MNIPFRLKIAILIKRFLRTGGAEKYAMEVVRRLAVDHDVHVFTQEWSFDGAEPITFHKIPRISRTPAWLNQLGFSYLCRKAVADGFDVVHSFEKVTTFDVMTVQSPCFKPAHLAAEGKWVHFREQVRLAFSPRKLAWQWIEARQFADDGARLFIAVSDYVKRNVQACYSLPDRCFRMAYTGVDAPKILQSYSRQDLRDARAQYGISDSDVVALFVGTEFKRKGLDALLRSLALMPRGRLKLLIAGGGGGKLDRYKRLAETMQLSTEVQFLGLVQNIERIYPLADIYVLPTLADPCPLAPLEAMAAGIPTVMSSSDFNGSAELVRNGEALILSDPRNPQEIANALTALLEPRRRHELAEKGRAVVRHATWDMAAAKTLATYRDVMQRKALGTGSAERGKERHRLTAADFTG